MQHPELVRSLVMIEPPGLTLVLDFPLRPGQVLSMLARSPLAGLAILKLGGTVMEPAAKAFRRGDDEAAIEMFGRGVLGSSRFDRLSPERYQQVWDNRKADKAQMLGEGFPPLDAHQVATVEVPTLLLVGSESPSAFHRMSARLLKLLPHARLDIVEGASHIVHEDAPNRAIKAIVDFLPGTDRNGPAV
jgi:pimeloyl-ACP methyl ester carboxylesterase